MSPKFISSALSKAQIISFLELPRKTKIAKEQLVAQLLQCIAADPNEKARLLNTFVRELVVGPIELEAVLQCSKEERKRWIKEGKIPVLEYRSFRKVGRDMKYPVHDRRVILAIPQEEIAQWRDTHQLLIQQGRKLGAQIAVERRRVNLYTRQTFLTSWQETVESWNQQGSPELSAVLQLAYWTGWVSRWAKENHIKYLRSTKYTAVYEAQRNAWYSRKNEAMYTLSQTPYAHLFFYRPEDADKMALRLCDEHYEEKIEGFYEDKWDFYAVHRSIIEKCPRCYVSVQKDYYSLYYLEVATATFPDTRFSFHMPYPIGKSLFPRPKKLPKVEHVEQDGIFRFGRTLFAYEKVTHREKDVRLYFEQSLTQVKQLYFVDYIRESTQETGTS